MRTILLHHRLKMFCIILLVFAVVLTGCPAAPTAKTDEKNKQEAKQITLQFWAAPVVDQADYEKIINKYTASVAPHVNIKLTYVPFNGIDEKVNAALAANTFPDVYLDGAARLGPLSVRGIAAPFDSLVTADYHLQDIMEGPLQLSKQHDQLTMLIMASNPQEVLMVNKSLFVKAGAEDLLPDKDSRAWSREKFSQAVEKIGGLGDGIYGLGLAAGAFDHDKLIDGYIYNDGDEYTNETNDKIIYNSAKNASNLDWLAKLAASKHTVPGAAGNNVSNIFEMFKQGKVGIMNYNPGYYEAIQKGLQDGSMKEPREVMFAHFPTTDGSVGKSWLSVYGLIVKKQEDAAKMKEAAKFAIWLTSGKDHDVNQMFYVDRGYIPVRKSLQTLVKEPEFKKLAGMPEKVIRNIFIIPNYQQMRKLWFNQFQQVLANRITAKEALDHFAKDAQKLLDEANQKQ